MVLSPSRVLGTNSMHNYYASAFGKSGAKIEIICNITNLLTDFYTPCEWPLQKHRQWRCT